MNCCHDINFLFHETITCIEGSMWNKTGPYCGSDYVKEEIGRLIDYMGQQSAKCQGVEFPTTNLAMFENSNQRIYVIKEKNTFDMRGGVLAFARVGWRALTLTDSQGFMVKQDMLCLYDIYVARKMQRIGFGRTILDFIFSHEKILPWQLAIEQPTQVLLMFFAKHYFLRDFTNQEEKKIIVWKRYMDEVRPTAKSGIRFTQPSHVFTAKLEYYKGGLWPIMVKPGHTNKDHAFVNWHPPTAASPGYNYELTPQQERVHCNAARNHDNVDRARALKILRYSHTPFQD